MYTSGGTTFPVRGCMSVARSGCACGPNPREGIHASPRITRVYTYEGHGWARGLRTIWMKVVHWWGLKGQKNEKMNLFYLMLCTSYPMVKEIMPHSDVFISEISYPIFTRHNIKSKEHISINII